MSTSLPTNASMTSTQWLMLLGLSFLWGGSFFFVEVIIEDLPPLTTVFFRVLLAAIALHLFLVFTGKKFPWHASAWIIFGFMGLTNNAIPFSLLVYGQTELASGVAAILNATTPMFTVALAHFAVADDRLTPMRAAGIAAAICGVAVMVGAAGYTGTSGATMLAYIACIGAPISYSIAVVYARVALEKSPIDPIMVAAGQLTASTFLMFPVMMWADQPWTLDMPGLPAIASVIGLAILSTAIAYIGYFKLLAAAGATNLSLVTILVPVSAILLGVTILGETLLLRHIAGFALIALGLALVDGRLFRSFQAKRA